MAGQTRTIQTRGTDGHLRDRRVTRRQEMLRAPERKEAEERNAGRCCSQERPGEAAEKGVIRGKGPQRRREAGWPPRAERAGDRARRDSSVKKKKKKEQTRELRTRQGEYERKHVSEGLRSQELSLWGPESIAPGGEEACSARSEVSQPAQRRQADRRCCRDWEGWKG